MFFNVYPFLFRCSMSEEDGAKLYDIYPHISDVVSAQCFYYYFFIPVGLICCPTVHSFW